MDNTVKAAEEANINSIKRLVGKYNSTYAMYVEYPHKSAWSEDFSDTDFKFALENLFSAKKNTPLLLYVHIPFCQRQCFYCTCHTVVERNYERIKNYLGSLFKEIDLLHDLFDRCPVIPNFREIHLGGGSPTILAESDFSQLIEKLKTIADLKKLDEFTIEIDPREVNREKLEYYHKKGINRISFGVQDFDPGVQKAVNRTQPPELLQDLLTSEVRNYFHGINFDIMWGLPKQTQESFRRTIDEVIDLSPDRVSLLLLHYAPDVKKHQRFMKESELPDMFQRPVLFRDAIQRLTGSGYIRIGLEHFAKPDDDLAMALENKTLYWNSLGYTSGRYFDIIGIGPGSSSNITGRYYFQNVYPIPQYESIVSSGRVPIYRGYRLNDDDIIRRDIIHRLRCYFSLDYRQVEQKYNIKVKEYFYKELAALMQFAKDGILNISETAIEFTELGKFFTFQVCNAFDIYKRGK